MAGLGKTKKLAESLEQLAEIVDKRAKNPKPDSYTARMLGRGKVQCAKKIGEEGVEVALAIAAEGKTEIANETADLLFHLFVGLRARGVSLNDIAEALSERRGTSGLTEKENR